jgi:murE/murF fusion protein
MQLKDYIPQVNKKYRNFFFRYFFDSSKVKKNYIFFAIKGNKLDGNDYIDTAIKKGAKVIVSEKKIIKKKNIIFLYSSNVRKLLANVSYKILGKKPKKLIAVTGTNGKSSIADFYYQILNLKFKKSCFNWNYRH